MNVWGLKPIFDRPILTLILLGKTEKHPKVPPPKTDFG